MKKEKQFPVISRNIFQPNRLRKASALLAGCVILAAAFLMVASLPVPISAGQGDSMPKVLRAGFLSRVFSDIDPRDAQATLELLTRELSRNMGLNTTPKAIVFPDTKSMADAIRRGELDLVSLPTIEYLRIRETVSLIPSFVGAHNNGMGTRYVLITRSDSGFRSISDFKGKTFFVPSANKHEAGHVWLDVLVMKEGKGNPATFFRQVKEAAKVSQAIMGVFFRQADGAIVTRAGLDASRLLNPQLDRQLVVLAESHNLSDGITCFPATASEKTRRTMANAVTQLSNSTTGRQLFTIFQTSGTIPFRPAFLEGIEDLLREQRRLKAKTTKRS